MEIEASEPKKAVRFDIDSDSERNEESAFSWQQSKDGIDMTKLTNKKRQYL